jgi:hypothetical protein
MILKMTVAALGLMGSLLAGASVTADAPRDPGAQARVDGETEKPGTVRSAEPTSGAASEPSAHAEISISLS